MAGMLELLDWKFKTIMIIILKTPTKKVENQQKQMSNVSRDIEILVKNKKY